MLKFIGRFFDAWDAGGKPSGRLPELVQKGTGLTESQVRALRTLESGSDAPLRGKVSLPPPTSSSIRIGVALEDIKKGQTVTLSLAATGIFHVNRYGND